LAGWLPDVHLNEYGRAQAAAVSQRLSKMTIHALYASPLDRTMETAQAIVAHHPHLTICPLETVGELRIGVWEGQELGKLAQRKMWRTVQFAPSRAVFPGGETFRAAQQRGVDALEALYEQHPRQTVAVVSHSDMIKLIVAHYLGLPLDLFQRLEISTASLTILELSTYHAVIKQMNETAYLPPEPRNNHAQDGQGTLAEADAAANTQTAQQT
jgi:probable phosphoglycerate mutase